MEAADAIRELLSSLDGDRPFLICIAGPNGAGKSTLYPTYIEPTLIKSGIDYEYLNADVVSLSLREATSGLSQKASDQVAQTIIRDRRQELISQERSLIYETVFSHPSKVEEMHDALLHGYFVVLIFVGLIDIELSKSRVLRRVQEGGHNVPEIKLEARFPRTLENLRTASDFVSILLLVDNSSEHAPFDFVILCGQEINRFIAEQADQLWASVLPNHFS